MAQAMTMLRVIQGDQTTAPPEPSAESTESFTAGKGPRCHFCGRLLDSTIEGAQP